MGWGAPTYWSNDGTSSGGSEPTAAVSLSVEKGVYSVLLGDATLPHMTVISASVFTNPDVWLRVWFNDGSHGFQQLSPDQRIAAVGCAMMAANVADGAVTSGKVAAGAIGPSHLAVGAVGSAQIASGAVGATQLSPGSALANLNASGQSGVAGGGGGVVGRREPGALGRRVRLDREHPVGRQLAGAHERRTSCCAVASHGGVDRQRDDYLGRRGCQWHHESRQGPNSKCVAQARQE